MSIKKLLALGLSLTVMLSGAVFADGEGGNDGGGEGGGAIVDPVVEKVALTALEVENCTVKIDGETVSSKEVDKDTEVELSAVPAENYEFVKWIKVNDPEKNPDGTDTDLSTSETYKLTVSEDTTVKAEVKVKEEVKKDPELKLAGTAKVGETLTAELANVEESTKVTYQWSMCSTNTKNSSFKNIADATEKTFTLTDDQEDKYVRVTAVIGEGETAAELTATTAEKVATSDGAPAAKVVTIKYADEAVSYKTEKYIVTRDDKKTVIEPYESKTEDADSKTIEPGKTIYVIKKDADQADDTKWTKIELPARPVMTQEVYGTKASYGANDGKLTNLVPGKMEYKLSTDTKWYSINKQGVYNLAPGDYWVRLRATDESFASDYKVVSVGQESKGSSGGGGGKTNSTYYSKNGQYGEISSTPTTAPSANKSKATFGDIETHWAKANIVRAVEKGLFSGIDENTFDPEGLTTRGMFITVIARLNGADLSGYKESKFADVSPEDYFGAAVAWGNEKNIITGIDENSFAPNETLSREQIAVILYRYAQLMNKAVTETADISGFADYSEVADYAKDALSWANKMGVVSGRDGNMLAPKGSATRAEVATMLIRFIDSVK